MPWLQCYRCAGPSTAFSALRWWTVLTGETASPQAGSAACLKTGERHRSTSLPLAWLPVRLFIERPSTVSQCTLADQALRHGRAGCSRELSTSSSHQWAKVTQSSTELGSRGTVFSVKVSVAAQNTVRAVKSSKYYYVTAILRVITFCF